MLTAKEPSDAAKIEKPARRVLTAKPLEERIDIEALVEEVKRRYPKILAHLAK